MALACGNNDVFSERLLEGRYHRDDGLEINAGSVNRVFQACPALEELHVLICDRSSQSDSLQDCITDELLLSIAKSCPWLKKLVIYETNLEYEDKSSLAVTDEGLVAISKLPLLNSIALKQTQCSAYGTLALIRNALDPGSRRHIALNVEDGNQESDSESNHGCFEVVLELMKYMLVHPKGFLLGRFFELELILQNRAFLPDHDETRAEMVELQEKLQNRHPEILLISLKAKATSRI